MLLCIGKVEVSSVLSFMSNELSELNERVENHVAVLELRRASLAGTIVITGQSLYASAYGTPASHYSISRCFGVHEIFAALHAMCTSTKISQSLR